MQTNIKTLVSLLLLGGLIAIGSVSSVSAMVNNNVNLPSSVQGWGRNPQQHCTYGGTAVHNHATLGWVSVRNQPTTTSVTVNMTQGDTTKDVVQFQQNILIHHCTLNMTSDTNPTHHNNLDNTPLSHSRLESRAMRRLGAHYESANDNNSTTTLNWAGPGSYREVNVAGSTYMSDPRDDRFYAKASSSLSAQPVNLPLELSGLSNLPVGTHNIIVTVNVRYVAQFNANHQCVLPTGTPSSDGITGSNCNSTPVSIPVQVNVTAPPPPPTNWNYNVNISTNPALSAPASPSTSGSYTWIDDGEDISLSSRARNVGNGAGPSYRHQIIRRASMADGTWGNWGNVSPSEWTAAQNAGLAASNAGTSDERTRSATFTVPNWFHGRVVCFKARVTPHAGQSTPSITTTSSGWEETSERCFRVRNRRWNYNVNLSPSISLSSTSSPSTSGSYTYVTAGTSINLSSVVSNSGDGTGLAFRHQIIRQYSSGGGWVGPNNVSPSEWNASQNPGLAAGASGANRSATFTVSDSLPHDTVICFRARVREHAGPSTPTIEASTSGWESTSWRCLRVRNLQYHLWADVNNAGADDPEPGSPVTFNMIVCNSEPVPASGGVAPDVDIFSYVGPDSSTTDNEVTEATDRDINRSARNQPQCWAGSRTITAGPVGVEQCVRVLANKNYGFSHQANVSNGNTVASECITPANRPYVEAFAGDVRACGTIGRIRAFNRGSSGSYAGARSQLAAFSNGNVQSFASAALQSALRPKGLTFSNTAGHATYGGGFDAGQCTLDDAWNPTVTPPISDETQPAETINSRVVRYIDGDLTITGDHVYGAGPWTITSSPYLRYVVRGNIYIRPNVTELNGDYVAVPRGDGTGGVIYTCAPNDSPTLADVAAATGCGDNLTVYGSFAAPTIRFLRVNGTMRDSGSAFSSLSDAHVDSTTNAGETFIQSPENWFVDINNLSGSPSFNGKYDAITALPPLL